MNLQVSIASRAALYLRVSTTRRAEVDLSIPDQRLQTTAYCERQGWQVVAEYVEPGASAMDDQRPEFQRMIERSLCSVARSPGNSGCCSGGIVLQ